MFKLGIVYILFYFYVNGLRKMSLCVYICLCMCVWYAFLWCILHLYLLWQQLGVGIGILYYILFANLGLNYYKLTI